MTDIRRTVLWVVFTMSLFLLWDAWNKHIGQPSLFGAPLAVPAASAPGQQAAAAPAAVTGAGDAAQPQPGGAAAASAPAERLTVQTDVLKVTVNTLGGDVDRVELLDYAENAESSLPWYEAVATTLGLQAKPPAPERRNVVILDEAGHQYIAQTGYTDAAGGSNLPRNFTPLAAAPGERSLKDGANELSLRLESPEVGGAKWVKTLTFHRGRYTIDVKNELTNVGSTPLSPVLYLQFQRDGVPAPGGSAFSSTFTGPAVYTSEKKYHKVEFKNIEATPQLIAQAKDGWLGVVQHYFASAWLVSAEGDRSFIMRKIKDNLYTMAMVQPLGELAPGATKTHQATLFVGPQEEKKLEALAPGLELVKDYGWLTILGKPLFWVMDQLHAVLGNWGWSIVGLVVLLKIAFFWLNAKAYKSMAKMKAVNPRITEMRERLKDKPQEMQQEMMRIYREEKVNPLGGCLPIFVQMPFFIALYSVLLSTVEMRGAPWIGWITDLSAKDPLFILPLVMTASSLVQVALGTKPPDPTQAKMMWMMPLVFSVMFFTFPSGLVLYWVTNNVLSIAQQWLINKRLGVA